MDKRHFALLVIDLHGLTVPPLIAAGRAVARMADRHGAVRKAGQDLRRKDLSDQPEILVRREHAVIIDRDAGALLPAVLQRKQPAVGQMCKVLRLRSHDAEYAAFFMQISHIINLMIS